MRLVRDTIAFTAAEMPRWHSISISGYHIREAGSTAAEELAFTLANGFAYVELAMQAGLAVDAFAPRLSFFFNAHIDFFEEIAKYRAARRIWARWMKERYGAHRSSARCSCGSTPRPPACRSPRSSPRSTSCAPPSRRSPACSAARSRCTPTRWTRRMALPTEKAARIALRTQQVIAHETNVAHVADPLGGSYFVEALTDEMERQAEELFAHLDELGDGSMLEGAIRGIEENWFQGKIADSAYELERQLNAGRRDRRSASTGSPRATTNDQMRAAARSRSEDEAASAQAARRGAPRPRPGGGRRRARPRSRRGRRSRRST